MLIKRIILVSVRQPNDVSHLRRRAVGSNRGVIVGLHCFLMNLALSRQARRAFYRETIIGGSLPISVHSHVHLSYREILQFHRKRARYRDAVGCFVLFVSIEPLIITERS